MCRSSQTALACSGVATSARESPSPAAAPGCRGCGGACKPRRSEGHAGALATHGGQGGRQLVGGRHALARSASRAAAACCRSGGTGAPDRGRRAIAIVEQDVHAADVVVPPSARRRTATAWSAARRRRSSCSRHQWRISAAASVACRPAGRRPPAPSRPAPSPRVDADNHSMVWAGRLAGTWRSAATAASRQRAACGQSASTARGAVRCSLKPSESPSESGQHPGGHLAGQRIAEAVAGRPRAVHRRRCRARSDGPFQVKISEAVS